MRVDLRVDTCQLIIITNENKPKNTSLCYSWFLLNWMSQQTTDHMWDFIHEILHISTSPIFPRGFADGSHPSLDHTSTFSVHRFFIDQAWDSNKYTSHPLILDSTEIVIFKVCREVIWCLNSKINCFISPYRGLNKMTNIFQRFRMHSLNETFWISKKYSSIWISSWSNCQ